jgi:hypothetical protein
MNPQNLLKGQVLEGLLSTLFKRANYKVGKRMFEKSWEVAIYAKRLTIMRIMARSIKVSEVSGNRSSSLTKRRPFINQPKVRSTTHRFLSKTKPFVGWGRSTTSRIHPQVSITHIMKAG